MPENAPVSAEGGGLAPHLDTPLKLFIQNSELGKKLQKMFSTSLGFKDVKIVPFPMGQGSASTQFAQHAMSTREGYIFVNVNHIPKIKPNAVPLEKWKDYLFDVKKTIDNKRMSTEKTLTDISKIVPIFEEAENFQIRIDFLQMFASFHIKHVFFLSKAASHDPKEQIKEWLPSVTDNLIDLLEGNTGKAEAIKHEAEEAKMASRKKEAERFMKEGDEFKKKGNFEEAVLRYNRAIDLFPTDLAPYIESGRGYAKLKKYSRAVGRFTEAEELSNEITTPNKEIAVVRVTQVREMLEGGADPESPEIKKLLDEATKNFQDAIKKAHDLQPLSKDEEGDRSTAAVSEIVGAMRGLELGDLLGARNPAAMAFAKISAEALKTEIGENLDTLPTSHLICAALIEIDKGNFEKGEQLLFRASEEKKYFEEAMRELNYLGTRLRKHKGPDDAVRLYDRIIALDPPNKGAVCYNLAAAWLEKGDRHRVGGYIVEAVYTDPSLPEDAMFYKNKDVVRLFDEARDLFRRVVELELVSLAPTRAKSGGNVEWHEPTPDPDQAAQVKQFEDLALSDRARAMKAVYTFTSKAPGFFEGMEVLNSGPLMDIIHEMMDKLSGSQNPDAVAALAVLQRLKDKERYWRVRERFGLEKFAQALQGPSPVKIFLGVADRRRAILFSDEFHENPAIMEWVKNMDERFRANDDPRLAKLKKVYETILHGAELRASSRPGEWEDIRDEFEALIKKDRLTAMDFLRTVHHNEPEFFSTRAAYESDGVFNFAVYALAELRKFQNDENQALADFIADFIRQRDEYQNFVSGAKEVLDVLEKTSDQRAMVNKIAQILVGSPDLPGRHYFFEHHDIVKAAKETHYKLSGVKIRGLDKA